MANSKTFVICKWCGESIQISIWQAICIFLAPKHCSDSCKMASDLSEEVISRIQRDLKQRLKGETPGSLKGYPYNIDDIILWPEHSKNYKKRN